VCGDASENWFDLLDGTVGCSREINGHALQHAQATSHALSVSFSDLSVWCYACDSYIVSPLLSDLLAALSHAKHSPSPAHLSGGGGGGAAPPSPSEVCASAPRVQAFADSFAAARNVMVILGAGASTSAGIPDFRTPGTGLYDNLQAYGLPSPEAVFSIDFFRSNPIPFNMLIRDLLPGAHKPTPTHAFLRMLSDQNKLLRVYSQNIDGLETLAGLQDERVVQCHGGFRNAHCIQCNELHSMKLIRDCCKMNANFSPDGLQAAGATTGPVIPTCDSCGGLVKPEITFFGEALPAAFFKSLMHDLDACDCLIVIGTSLKVMPVCRLPSAVYQEVPRMVINRDAVGEEHGMFGRSRDAFLPGTCDDGVKSLCDLSGLHREFATAVGLVDSEFTHRESRDRLAPSSLPSGAACAIHRVAFSMQQ
jgi:NAD-dependent SIR2 family protein deacetylase